MKRALQSVDRKKENLGMVYMWFCTICRNNPKRGQLQYCTPFLEYVWRTMVKGNPPSGQNFEQWTGLIVLLKRRNSHMYNCVFCTECYVFVGCGQLFGWMVKNLEGTWLKNWWQGSLRQRYVDTSLWMGEKYEDIFVPCECFPKGDLSRRGF